MGRRKIHIGTADAMCQVSLATHARLMGARAVRGQTVSVFLRAFFEENVEVLAPETEMPKEAKKVRAPAGDRQRTLTIPLLREVLARYRCTAASRGESLSLYLATCLDENLDALAPQERAA